MIEHANGTSNVQSHTQTSRDVLPQNTSAGVVLSLQSTVTEPQFEDTILPTATIFLCNADTVYGPFRTLCDSGSQIDLIRTSKTKQLPIKTCKLNAWGINDKEPMILHQHVTMELLTNKKQHINVQLNLVCVENIAGQLPTKLVTMPVNQIPEDVRCNLADPSFRVPNNIDILLSAHTFAKIVKSETKMITNDIVAQNTKLGWIVYGKQNNSECRRTVALFTNVNKPEQEIIEEEKEEEQLNTLLKKLWEIDQMDTKVLSEEHKQAEEIFVKTHYRDSENRFVAQIPLKASINELGSSREIALKRFYQLERRFARQPEVRAEYVKFMRNYESSGHMTLCTRNPINETYYIPHHAVLKKKLRVVFDASCKTDTGLSLNDVQLIGGKLQGNLVDILLRCRCFKFVMAADVVQMFRQIKIAPEQYDLQRIFWREKETEPIKEYWLTCVTQGMASAAYNAVRAMIQCARDNANVYPLAAEAIENNFYMDDGLFGAHDLNTARDLYHQINDCLSTAGFKLEKWQANQTEAFKSVGINIDSPQDRDLDSTTSILGLQWSPEADTFSIKVNTNNLGETITKRKMLAEIAKIYDPCGYFVPVTIIGRIIMQETWKLKVDWNQTPPEEIKTKWQMYYEQLPLLTQFKIPRWLNCNNTTVNQLHGFADASTSAYGAVVYMRTIDENGKIHVSLVMARARVAPIKTISIARLELCAAVLLAQLIENVSTESGVPLTETTLWSDSMVVLHWIRKLPASLDTFVGNRVSTIQEITKNMNWRYVPSKENPADLISRGIMPAKFVKNNLWSNGPDWLVQQENAWPQTKLTVTEDEAGTIQSEVKGRQPTVMANTWKMRKDNHGFAVLVNIQSLQNETVWQINGRKALINILKVKDESILKRRPTLLSVLRVTAMVTRFIKKLRKQDTHKSYIKIDECREALLQWIRFEQGAAYKTEIAALQKNNSIENSSKILALTPWLDSDGVLKVGGRIQNSCLTFDEKHPVILPKESELSRLITEHTHKLTIHGKPQLMMNTLRQKYWIPKMRQLVKRCIHHCVVCIRFRKETATQLMANLPAERLLPNRCFRQVGIDLAGPITVRARYDRTRTARLAKGYICVFVCLVTRAVHLEPVENPSAEAFLAAFSRMISRRGPVDCCWSDHGGNFVKASKELKEIADMCLSDATQQQLQNMNVNWKFITPGGPHQGGLWESAVRIMKHHLNRTMKLQVYTWPVLTTVLCQIEACMNSRPIAPLSDDVSDNAALTPAHFIIGEPILQPFHKPVLDVPDNRLNERGTINKVTQAFWKRFQDEYIKTLQQRNKWRQRQPNIQIDDLVLIKNETLPPTLWQLGRVIEIIDIAKDGLVRKVKVRTETSPRGIDRPVQKLCVLLPVSDKPAD